MNVLVIGSGGREHAIVWKLKQSPKLKNLYALPGNPGTADLAENVSGISLDDHAAIVDFCKKKDIDLVIVGPEAPLAAGMVDVLSEEENTVFWTEALSRSDRGVKGLRQGFHDPASNSNGKVCHFPSFRGSNAISEFHKSSYRDQGFRIGRGQGRDPAREH
jgi:hypothetical protein